MPEFKLNGSNSLQYNDLCEFTRGYIEALFFTEHSHIESEQFLLDPSLFEGSIPSDYGFDDLAPETLKRIIEDCAGFELLNSKLLNRAYDISDYTPEQAGRDYWFSRNGHGVGFWDRGLDSIGDALHEACKHKECTAYIGYDGKVYLS